MPALAVYAICLAVYGLTAGAAIGWLDAPELVAASSSLGIPHSPGHPLVVMIGKFATLLPIGDIPFRVALASAMTAAAAATATFYLVRSALPARDRPVTWHTDGAAFAAALAVAFSWAMWFQATRAEVYALESLLVLAALGSAVSYQRSSKPRHLMTFAVLAVLAAINHPAIAATVLVPAACLSVWRTRTSVRRVGFASLAGLAALASVLYLPIRAATDPALNWGDPSTFGRLLWTLSGSAFHKTAGAEHTSSLGQDLAQALVAVASGATIPLSLLAVLCLYMAVRNRQRLALVTTLVAVVVLGILGRAVLGFDPETPDHHGYLVPAIVALATLGVLGLAMLAETIEGLGAPSALARPSAALALLLLALVQLGTNVERSSLADARASDRLVNRSLGELPPRTVLLSAYFETRFQIYAAQEVFGLRPDIRVLDRSFLTYPGAAEHEARRHPELAALINAPLRAGTATPLAALDDLSRSTPVFVELHVNVDRGLRANLAPLGAFAIYTRLSNDARRRQIEALDAAAMERLAKTAATDVRFDGERAMLSYVWRDYLRLALYCEHGRRSAAETTFARLRTIIDGDRKLDTLAKNCGLDEK